MYQTYQRKYPPWSIKDVDHFFQEKLLAVRIPFDHPELYHDVFMPSKENTAGVYGIYDQAILYLLQGRVESIHDMEFSLLTKKSTRYNLDDIDTILTIGALVVLETEDHQTIKGCFIGGEMNLERLYHVVTYIAGVPELSNEKLRDEWITDYLKSVQEVKRMGFVGGQEV